MLFRLLCCSSYLPRFLCCLLRFIFLSFAPSFLVLFPFVRRLCLSSALVAWCVFRLLFPYFLVRSLCPQFFQFCLSSRYSSFVLCLSSLLYSPFRSLSSTPLLRPPLGLLCCLCFSTVLCISHPPPGFFPLFWGLVSVRLLAAAPTVSVITPLLFRPLGLFRSSTLDPIIISPFPHTAFPIAPSSLTLRFSLG